MTPYKRLCSNCKFAVPIYKKGTVIALICEHDLDFFKGHEALPEDLSEEVACGRWIYVNGDE